MHYKLIKILKTTICDEHIDNKENILKLIKSIIDSNVNISISYYNEERDKIIFKEKVKIKKLINNEEILVNIQTKQSAFKCEIKIDNIKSIFLVSEKDVVKIDESNTRYEYLDLD